MPNSEAALPETHERRCPICRSEMISPAGHVLAAGGMIKVKYRCDACGISFFVVRKPLA
jgi:transposase-like protein